MSKPHILSFEAYDEWDSVPMAELFEVHRTGRIMAMGSLIVLPPLLFTFFAARQIIAGMTAGAVKG